MRKNADTFHNLCCTILHQTIISSDIWLTFRGVNNQRFNFIATALQFNASREACTAETRHAKLMNTRN